jgi:hypothetical protein
MGFVQDKSKKLLAGLDLDSVVSWILFLTVPIRLSNFYHGSFVFFVLKTVFYASAPHKMIKTLLSIKFCTLRLVSHSNIAKTGKNRELVLLEKKH